MRERSGYYWDVMAWRNSRRVRAMDHITKAIYREVMDEIWINGAVPNDPGQIAILTHWPLQEVVASWPQIHNCLTPTKKDPDLFTSERLERERRNRDEYHRSKRQAGHLGGKRSAEKRRQLKAVELVTDEAKSKQCLSDASDTLKQNQAIPSTSPSSSSSSRNKSLGKTDPPKEFPITDDMHQWGTANGFSEFEIQRETAAMLDYFRGKGERKADWVATWRNWMRNSRKFNGSSGNGTHTGNSGTNARAAQAGTGFSARPYTPKQ